MTRRKTVTRALGVLVCTAALGCASGEAETAETSFGPGGGPDSNGTESSTTDGTGGTSVASASDSATSTSGPTTSTSSTTSATNTTTGPGCTDMDMDGYGDGCAAGADCNDDNDAINPGADETCNGEDDNCDDMIDNGCECDPDGVSQNCNMPTDLGEVNAAGMAVGPVGNVAQEGGIDWYTVSFPLAGRPGAGTPTLSLVVNEGEAFAFDVVGATCVATGIPCQSGGDPNMTAVGLTDWSFVDNDPGCCTPPMDSLVGWPSQVWVRVYRTTAGASCATYQLQATR